MFCRPFHLILLSLAISFLNCENEDCFRAAVFQHLPLGNLTSEEIPVIVKRNLDVFERIASIAAKEGVQMLVYPEDAIINTRYPRSVMATIAERIPDPLTGTHNPCDNPLEYEDRVKTYRLSCFAKHNNLYIVGHYGDRVDCHRSTDVNCPADGYNLYNTDVAFGPDGQVLAKYHKMQLFHEYHYNVPKDEFIYFDTPFGRMGLFVCFDILFRNPGTDLVNKYGVQTMIYPLWWFELEAPPQPPDLAPEVEREVADAPLLSNGNRRHSIGRPLRALWIFLNCENEDCFRAAVFQHLPLGNLTSEEIPVIVKRNLDVFERIASIAAKEGVQMLVYPEDAIINTRYPRSVMAAIAERIPDPLTGTHIPCDNPSEYEDRVKTYRLSCFAKHNNLYIVGHYGDRVDCDRSTDVNCPADGYNLYNTDVAFGPDGQVLAKYHKMQLFHEYHYNVPKDEFIHFDTPFGRMGLFVCFDILFRNPGTDLVNKYGVQTMIYPLWWFDELPFKSANQVQQSWAYTYRVNLLASDMHSPQSGSSGSGIYSGENGAIIDSNIMDQKAVLLIADIPIDSKNTGAKCLTNRYTKRIEMDDIVDTSEYRPLKYTDWKGSAFYKLKGQSNSAEVCNNGFCCQLVICRLLL
ncbi:unnamed protein product [Medioppia subpectinata]|uniref:CN hydrolase domain-containing protein n=1 Tax=Medioppia subpectinata TaxID=1979941 RepID=A0A7R9KDY8_9ACAR|nr:unnamed protein product [Medioppia subpectinata]CAG2100517.1 unnamed protein product [Medioppia subpectinata]